MLAKNQFSFQRVLLLGKQSFYINKKQIVRYLAVWTGQCVLLLFLFQHMANYVKYQNKDYMVLLIALFFINGLTYAGFSFPGFRSKEKAMSYLMLPASNAEKFLFELLTRIVLFLFLMPVCFWIVANLEGMILHSFVPEFVNYKFSFGKAYSGLINAPKLTAWGELFMFQGILFVLIAPFTGAVHFSNSPLIKTLLTFFLVVAGLSLLNYILIQGLALYYFDPRANSILFMGTQKAGFAFLAIFSLIINVGLLFVAWFGFKEKEV
jgi:hypothetical protein